MQKKQIDFSDIIAMPLSDTQTIPKRYPNDTQIYPIIQDPQLFVPIFLLLLNFLLCFYFYHFFYLLILPLQSPILPPLLLITAAATAANTTVVTTTITTIISIPAINAKIVFLALQIFLIFPYF